MFFFFFLVRLFHIYHQQMRSNALSWSPTFPTSLLLASEDHNLYTFDIRKLAVPTQIYKAHVAAVMSCDWSPTGLEFVSGGWDRTVRIWKEGVGTGPEVYHTKRMQRFVQWFFCTGFDTESLVHIGYHHLYFQQTHDSCYRAPTTGTCGYGKLVRPINWVSSPLESGQQWNTGTV